MSRFCHRTRGRGLAVDEDFIYFNHDDALWRTRKDGVGSPSQMTSLADVKVWQDVYHVPYGGLVLYVKLTVDDEGKLLLSFKEK